MTRATTLALAGAAATLAGAAAIASAAALAPAQVPPTSTGATRSGGAAWVRDLASSDPVAQDLARRHLFARPGLALPALEQQLVESDPRAFASRLLLLAAMAPERTAPFLERAAAHPHPAVRAAAATAFAAVDSWEPAVGRALLAADDASVPLALLEALDARTLPDRSRFAASFGADLEALIDRGDPRARRLALRLLVLDDADPGRARFERLLPQLTADERSLAWDALLARPPRWSDASLQAIARGAEPDRGHADPKRRLLALHLLIRFDPEFRATVDDDVLLELLRYAGHPPGAPEEHAAASLALLGPAVAPRLVPLLPTIAAEGTLELALVPFLRLRGRPGLDDLIALLLSPRDEPCAALPILALLGRLPCVAVAALLEERIAPRLAPSLRPALTEAAFRMPPCAPRQRLLRLALEQAEGDLRLRAFEALARTGDAELLPTLELAFQSEPQPRLRARMLTQLAASFGKTRAERLLALLQSLLDGTNEGDRVAALEAIPFVDLGGREDAIVADLVKRFAASAPDSLLHALAQIGGKAVEATFVELAPRVRDDPAAENGYRFLLARAQAGAASRALLVAALDDERARIRETALRALIERADPIALERAPAVLATLSPLARESLFSELSALHELPGYPPLVRKLLDEAAETSARLALLELAEPALREVLAPAAVALLEDSADPDERIAALEALGRLGGDDARAILEERVAAALALEDARFGAEEPRFDEGRAALLQLASLDPAAQSPRAATMLLRIDAAHARERSMRAALGRRDDSAQPDPALLALLASRPSEESVAALEEARRSLGEAADLLDERFLSACARSAAASGGAESLCDWFDEAVLTTWPVAGAADFRALLPQGWRRDLLRSRAWEEVDAAFLEDARAIAAAFPRAGEREAEEALGGSDPLLGVTPARTLAVLTTLARERDADGGPAAVAIEAAAREAFESPPLLRGVARLAARERRDLGPGIAARLAEPAPAEAELAELRRALEDERR